MSSAAIQRKGPFLVEVVAGRTYYWWTCGLSRRQPFCDGTHKSTALEPVAYTATEPTTVEQCGCKQTATRPFCDGTHENL